MPLEINALITLLQDVLYRSQNVIDAGEMARIDVYGPPAIFLGGAAVLSQYRGRGVYRALVASRWRAAVAIGKPALTIHAGEMSKPILERCGFEAVCQIDVLLDPALG